MKYTVIAINKQGASETWGACSLLNAKLSVRERYSDPHNFLIRIYSDKGNSYLEYTPHKSSTKYDATPIIGKPAQ